MDEKKIKKLIKILEETDLSELTVEEEGVKITVRKGPLTIIESKGEKEIASAKDTASSIQHPPAGGERAGPASGKKEPETAYKEIVSPMVGTFYRAPAPDADPFANEGDVVEKGQTVCIIEAMKLMNEIPMEEKGKIIKVLVENAQSVEYGQVLLLYEPVV